MEMAYQLTEHQESELPVDMLPLEHWTQDTSDPDLWHGPHNVIVNSSALNERRAFYTLITHKR